MPAKVSREEHRFDIQILLESVRTVLVIENKVYAEAGEHQLSTYRKRAEDLFPTYNRVFVYLTPGGEEAQEGFCQNSGRGAH